MESAQFDKTLLENDLLFKMLIIGDSGVGKSCLLLRYADGEYPGDHHIPTIGVDFKIRTVEMDGKIIKLNMWDTAGQERFKTITSTFYRGSHGCILVFDLTDMESFNNIPTWLESVDKFGGGHVAKMLIGTKCDMKDKRIVPYEQAQALADRLGLPYLETSAKIATNVEQAFMTMTAEMKAKFDTGSFKKRDPIILSNGTTALADRLGVIYIETSAKTDTNVEQAFMTLTAEMKQKFDTGSFKKTNDPVKLTTGTHDVNTHSRLWNMFCSC